MNPGVSLRRRHHCARASRLAHLIVTLCLGVAALPAAAAPVVYRLVPEQSRFTVVTHSAGVAGRFGHNHLIAADEYTARLVVDHDDLPRSTFDISVPVQSLRVDVPEVDQQLEPVLRALDFIDEPLPELSAKDRQGLRDHMFSASQLDADKYPTIKARLMRVEARPAQVGSVHFTHHAVVELTIRDKTVTHSLPANIEFVGDQVGVVVAGTMRFTEFGIKPFAAAFGLLKNADQFDIFVNVKAKAPSAP